jgi:intracellular septation protein
MNVTEDSTPKERSRPPVKSGGWIKPAIEYGPVVLFFIALKTVGLMPATAVLIVASLLAVFVGFMRDRRLPWGPIVTTVIVVIFGSLTLIFKDETFIKMKPTVVYALFAVSLWVGLLLKKPLLERLIGGGLKMDHAGWRKLEARYAWFCAVMAILNEIVWRTQSTDVWGDFKLGSIVLTFLFMATQLPMIRRHMLADEPETESNRS